MNSVANVRMNWGKWRRGSRKRNKSRDLTRSPDWYAERYEPKRGKCGDGFTVKANTIFLRFEDQKQECCRKLFRVPPICCATLTRYWPKDVCKGSHSIYPQSQSQLPWVCLTLRFIESTLSPSGRHIKGWDTARLVGLGLSIVSQEPGG